MDEAEHLFVYRLPLALDVRRLASDESRGSGSLSEFADDTHHCLGSGRAVFYLCQQLECFDDESVSGQQSSVLIKLHMA